MSTTLPAAAIDSLGNSVEAEAVALHTDTYLCGQELGRRPFWYVSGDSWLTQGFHGRMMVLAAAVVQRVFGYTPLVLGHSPEERRTQLISLHPLGGSRREVLRFLGGHHRRRPDDMVGPVNHPSTNDRHRLRDHKALRAGASATYAKPVVWATLPFAPRLLLSYPEGCMRSSHSEEFLGHGQKRSSHSGCR